MAEHTLEIRLTCSQSALRWGLTGLLLTLVSTELSSESLSLTTYYPAPSGIYSQMITTGPTWLARDGGFVGIGVANPTSALDVAGEICAADAAADKLCIRGNRISFSPGPGSVAGDTVRLVRGSNPANLHLGHLTTTAGLTLQGGHAPGRVLTSDASGNASWQPPTGGLLVHFPPRVNQWHRNEVDVQIADASWSFCALREFMNDQGPGHRMEVYRRPNQTWWLFIDKWGGNADFASYASAICLKFN
jgi:hypothetical protein